MVIFTKNIGHFAHFLDKKERTKKENNQGLLFWTNLCVLNKKHQFSRQKQAFSENSLHYRFVKIPKSS